MPRREVEVQQPEVFYTHICKLYEVCEFLLVSEQLHVTQAMHVHYYLQMQVRAIFKF